MANAQARGRVFSRAEVSALKGDGGVPMILHGKVYDVADYLDHHPGGSRILKEVAGLDATAAFEDVGHSDDARLLLEKFCIGSLADHELQQARRRVAFTSMRVGAAIDHGRKQGLSATIAALANNQSVAQQLLTFACILFVARMFWPEPTGWRGLSASIRSLHPFWRGIAVSSASSGACFWAIGSQFSKTIVMTKGFRAYPPVMKPNKALVGPLRKVQGTSDGVDADASTFRPLQLVERSQVTSDGYKLVLQYPQPTHAISGHAGQHVQLRAQVGDQQVIRSYTPVASRTSDGVTTVELAIKVYPEGKLGRYLLDLPLNGHVDGRGPLGSFRGYHRFLCKKMGAIVGGSGITPTYSVLKHICEDKSDNTSITLVYANTSPDKILLGAELADLACRHPSQLQVHFLLTGPTAHPAPEAKGKGWSQPSDTVTSTRVHRGRLSAETMKELLPAPGVDTKYLVCGPDGMVQHVTKSLVGMGAQEPQPLPHVTDQVFVF